MSSVRKWDELVAEGRELKVMEERIEAEHGNVRWMWGDLALEVAPMGADQAHNGALDKLRRYAEELDVSYESLRQYRAVADKWPHGTRSPSQPWIVHQQVMGRDDREELLANPVDVRTGEKMERWTYRAVQRFLNQKPSPGYRKPPSSVEEKAAQARDLLADPEVAAATFATGDADTAERNARSAIAKNANERAKAASPETPNTAPLKKMGRQLDASEHIARARKSLARALDVIQQLNEQGDLDEFRDHLRRRLDAVEVVADWVRTYLDGGETSFDEELSALLSEEA